LFSTGIEGNGMFLDLEVAAGDNALSIREDLDVEEGDRALDAFVAGAGDLALLILLVGPGEVSLDDEGVVAFDGGGDFALIDADIVVEAGSFVLFEGSLDLLLDRENMDDDDDDPGGVAGGDRDDDAEEDEDVMAVVLSLVV
jgi:hypothetical protein